MSKEIRTEIHTTKIGKRVRREIEFSLWLNGELVGYAKDRIEAEETLNNLVYNLLEK